MAFTFRNMSENIDLENPFGEFVELEITDSIDLHAFAPRDVRAVTEAYLAEAHKKGFRMSASFTAKASACSARPSAKFSKKRRSSNHSKRQANFREAGAQLLLLFMISQSYIYQKKGNKICVY